MKVLRRNMQTRLLNLVYRMMYTISYFTLILKKQTVELLSHIKFTERLPIVYNRYVSKFPTLCRNQKFISLPHLEWGSTSQKMEPLWVCQQLLMQMVAPLWTLTMKLQLMSGMTHQFILHHIWWCLHRLCRFALSNVTM